MDMTTITGITASLFTATSLLPQLVKLLKEKEAKDISIGMLVILITGLGFWVWYGILKKDPILIGSNSFSLLVTICVVVLSLKYKNK